MFKAKKVNELKAQAKEEAEFNHIETKIKAAMTRNENEIWYELTDTSYVQKVKDKFTLVGYTIKKLRGTIVSIAWCLLLVFFISSCGSESDNYNIIKNKHFTHKLGVCSYYYGVGYSFEDSCHFYYVRDTLR